MVSIFCLVRLAVFITLVSSFDIFRNLLNIGSKKAKTSSGMHLSLLNPVFNLPKDGVNEKVKSYMKRCIGVAAEEPKSDCVYYGWDVSEDGSKLFCREAYTSADALLRRLDGAGPIVDEMLKECGMSAAQFEVVCNKGDVDKLKGPCSVFDANYRVCYDGFDNGYIGSSSVGNMHLSLLNPVFNLPKDGVNEKVKSYMKRCIGVAAEEPKSDCVYYGWDVSEDGSKLFCREAYTSADALLRHLDGAGPIVDEMLKECGMSVAQFEVVCNKGDVDKLKGPCSVFDANYRVCYDGFDNGYEVSKRQ